MLACYHQWFHTNLKYALGKMGDDSYKETVKNRNKRNDKDEKNIHKGKAVWDSLNPLERKVIIDSENRMKERKRSSNEDEEKMEAGKTAWNSLNPLEKEAILESLDFMTESGRRLIMNTDVKKLRFGRKPCGNYLIRQIRWAVQGRASMNMGAEVGKSISKSGFGIGVFLHPTFIIQTMLRVQQIIWRMFRLKFYIGGRPHIAFKVGGGGNLRTHHDNPRPYELFYDSLENVLAGPSRPNSAWLAIHGVQTIIHLKGATVSGNTYTLSNMDPWRNLILLCLLHPKHMHTGMYTPKNFNTAKWFKQIEKNEPNKGPVFFPWEHKQNLCIINRIVSYFMHACSRDHRGTAPSIEPVDSVWFAQFQHEQPDVYQAILMCKSPIRKGEIKIMPIRRLAQDDVSTSNYLGIWLKGFLHGSTPTKEDRITIIPHFAIQPLPISRVSQFAQYQQMHAHSGSENEKENIRKWWKQNRKTEQYGNKCTRTSEYKLNWNWICLYYTNHRGSGLVPTYCGTGIQNRRDYCTEPILKYINFRTERTLPLPGLKIDPKIY